MTEHTWQHWLDFCELFGDKGYISQKTDDMILNLFFHQKERETEY